MPVNLTKDQEKELVAKCLNHDKEAWDTFVATYKKTIYGKINKTYTRYKIIQQAGCKDLIFKEVFIKFAKYDFKVLKRFDYRVKLSTWVGVVTRSVTVDHMRKEKKETERKKKTVSMSEKIEDGRTIEETIGNKPLQAAQLHSREINTAIRKARESLSLEERQIIDLFFDNEVKIEYIAKALRISVAAVNMRKKRALDKIKAELKKSVILQESVRILQ